jgi:hypothetical protein
MQLTQRAYDPVLHAGIGVVVPAKQILDVLDQPVLRNERNRHDEALRRRNLPMLDGATDTD